MATATFAAGCFWGIEEAFRTLPGVTETAVGYTGGHQQNPNYRQVCRGDTGHAEAVEVTFDPAVISFGQLLEVFWAIHDPTQLNRQGPDWGHQYRTAIFTHSEEQAQEAEASKQAEDRSGRHRSRIVTEITPASTFWRAEDYHQKYVLKQGGGGCGLAG